MGFSEKSGTLLAQNRVSDLHDANLLCLAGGAVTVSFHESFLESDLEISLRRDLRFPKACI